MGGGDLAFVAAIASAVAIIISALRKRKDVDVVELQKRGDALEVRVEILEGLVDGLRIELVGAERNVFLLRRVLAREGIPDPTMEASA